MKIDNGNTGNIGLPYACYGLGMEGWEVMRTAGNARGKDILAVLIAVSTLVSCTPKHDSKQEPAMGREENNATFHCEKLPGVSGLRLCNATDKYCGDKEGGCFKRPKAHCYIRSAVGDGAWSTTEKTVPCFPTIDECTKDREGEGAWGPPPLQTPCREMSPDELPN